MYVCIHVCPLDKKFHIYKIIFIFNKHYSQRFYLSANNILRFFFQLFILDISASITILELVFFSSNKALSSPGLFLNNSYSFFIMEPYRQHPAEDLTHNIKTYYRFHWC